MNKITLTILFLMNLCLSNCLDSVATKPYGTDWKKTITEEGVEEILGMPDTMDINNDMGNVRYIYSKKMTCHFRMQNGEFILYAFEITGGEVNGIKISMSKRKIENFLGKPNEEIRTKRRITMEWNQGRHIVIAKFEKRKLQELTIAKVL